METRRKKESKINSLPDSHVETIRLVIQKLETLAGMSKEVPTDPLITEESVKELESIVLDLAGMKNSHQKYLLRWVKQGYLLD